MLAGTIRNSSLRSSSCSRNPGLAAKLEAERRLKEGISGHKTGLPKKLLELFNARPPLEKKSDLKRPKPKVPHIGLAKYVSEFKEPDDPEYEPGPPKTRPSSPRRYRNPEMRAQARIDDESKLEKYVFCSHLQAFHTAHLKEERVSLSNIPRLIPYAFLPHPRTRTQGRKAAELPHDFLQNGAGGQTTAPRGEMLSHAGSCS